MKTINKAAILLLTIVMTGASQVVLAQDTIYCGSPEEAKYYLDILRGDIEASDFGKRRNAWKDEAGLVGKTIDAGTKVTDEKYSDANGKLDDILEKVDDLLSARKTKINPDDGKKIMMSTIDAMDCIADL